MQGRCCDRPSPRDALTTLRLLSPVICLSLLSALLLGCIPLWQFPTPIPTITAETATPTTTEPPPTASPTLQPQATIRPSPVPQPSPTPEPTTVAHGWLDQELALLPEARDSLQLLHNPTTYVMELSIDADAAQVSGQVDIHYTNNETLELSEIPLRLFPNSDTSRGGCTNVSVVQVDGQDVTPRFELADTVLWLPLSDPLNPADSIDISVGFDVCVPPGDGRNFSSFAAKQGVIALAHFYPFVPVYDDEGWNIELAPYYGDIIYADISLYDVTVTTRKDLTLVATGVVLSQEETGEGMIARRVVSGPARDFNMILSHQYTLVQDEVDGIVVNSYFLPGRDEGGAEVLDVAKQSLHIFNQRFGPYPYTEFDVASTFTSAAGIEYPGLVVIADRLYDGDGRSEWVVAHEVAHQWWYNMVGNDQVDDPWVDEALTQYSTALYYGDRYGAKSGASAIQVGLLNRWEVARSDGRDRAVAGPLASFAVEDYGPIVYGKGPLFFHALRDKVGDAAFDEFLCAYLLEHLWRIATPESLLSVAETTTAQNLDDLYR